jgi:hypothetical protein
MFHLAPRLPPDGPPSRFAEPATARAATHNPTPLGEIRHYGASQRHGRDKCEYGNPIPECLELGGPPHTGSAWAKSGYLQCLPQRIQLPHFVDPPIWLSA